MHISIIAGPSNVGKSTVAAAIARVSGSRVLHVDDLSRQSDDPALAFERDSSIWQESPEDLRDLLVAKGTALWPDVETWIEASTQANLPTIVEGEGPSPEDVRSAQSTWHLRCVFIVETDPKKLDATLMNRSQSYRELPDDEKSNVVTMNVLYGEWLREECERLSLPCIGSRPWVSLPNRCRDALES